MHTMFQDISKKFVVTLFVEEDDYKLEKKEIENLGNQKNIKLVVQPCPFEAVEFLYRIDFDIKGHVNSFDKRHFWQALTLPASLTDDELDAISKIHHAYLVAIVQNDAPKIQKQVEALRNIL